MTTSVFVSGCNASTPQNELDEPLLKDFSRGSLQIDSGDTSHQFSIYIADSPRERRQGLMFIESMPDDVGMLFLYPAPTQISMWMKNTVLSLDMLFIESDGTVESIARDATPGSLKSIASKGNVCCVLELNAGTSDKLGLQPGDQLRHTFFRNE